MTDVVEIALKRRDRLRDEVAQLDDFIQMAGDLMRGVSNDAEPPSAELSAILPDSDADGESEPKADAPKTESRPPFLRRGPGLN